MLQEGKILLLQDFGGEGGGVSTLCFLWNSGSALDSSVKLLVNSDNGALLFSSLYESF